MLKNGLFTLHQRFPKSNPQTRKSLWVDIWGSAVVLDKTRISLEFIDETPKIDTDNWRQTRYKFRNFYSSNDNGFSKVILVRYVIIILCSLASVSLTVYFVSIHYSETYIYMYIHSSKLRSISKFSIKAQRRVCRFFTLSIHVEIR